MKIDSRTISCISQVEAAYQKQIRKTEEEKSNHSALKHEVQSLSESCDKLNRNCEKLNHDIQSKNTHISCLEGQLSNVKQQLEAENTKNGQLKADLERAQMEHGATMKKLGKVDEENGKRSWSKVLSTSWRQEKKVKLLNFHLDTFLGKNQNGILILCLISCMQGVNYRDNF